MIQQFLVNGKEYNVHVMSLTQNFTVKDAADMEYTQDGGIYRDPLGTYYNYTMTIAEKDGDREALDAFFDEISKPVKSHVCVFPHNQVTMTQNMYVTSGGRSIRRLKENATHWGEVTINFVAMAPKVVAE